MSTRFRGCGVGPETTSEMIAELKQLGCNMVRYEIAPQPHLVGDEWKSEVIRHSNQLYGLVVNNPEMNFVADLHHIPFPSIIGDAWRIIHGVVGGCPNVKWYGYLNEPPYSKEVCREVMLGASDAVGFGKTKKIPICTYPYSDPPHFKAAFPYGIKRSVFEVHMYLPLSFTHQSVPGMDYPAGPVYPGYYTINDKQVYVNQEWLARQLKPVRTFQLKYRRHIFVGEFSASNFADETSRLAYLKDCIDLFELWGFSWSYHAMGIESDIWKPSPKVLELLKSYWKKNV